MVFNPLNNEFPPAPPSFAGDGSAGAIAEAGAASSGAVIGSSKSKTLFVEQ